MDRVWRLVGRHDSFAAEAVDEHKSKLVPGFTQKYNVTKLVWFEAHNSVRAAIQREKEIKAWRRAEKVALIEAINPGWQHLSLGPRPLHEAEIELIQRRPRSKPKRDFSLRKPTRSQEVNGGNGVGLLRSK